MKALILAAALAAPADPMAGFYGNTVRVEVPAVFYVMVRYIDPDGTGAIPTAARKGVWRIENGQSVQLADRAGGTSRWPARSVTSGKPPTLTLAT